VLAAQIAWERLDSCVSVVKSLITEFRDMRRAEADFDESCRYEFDE